MNAAAVAATVVGAHRVADAPTDVNVTTVGNIVIEGTPIGMVGVTMAEIATGRGVEEQLADTMTGTETDGIATGIEIERKRDLGLRPALQGGVIKKRGLQSVVWRF